MNLTKTIPIAALALAVIGLAWPAMAVLATDKDAITFNSLDDSAALLLSGENGKPIPARDIKSVQLMASGHDYSKMLNIQKKNGELIIKPTNIEVGTYSLVINTTAGQKIIQINAPLANMPGNIEKIAAARGVSPDVVRQEMGLTTPVPRSTYTISLPQSYFVGQRMDLTIPAEQGTAFQWTVNGKIVKEGTDANTLSYVFSTPGDYVIGFIETKNGVPIGSASSTTSVRQQDPVAWSVATDTIVAIPGPAGYQHYAWMVDGNVVSNDQDLDMRFARPGDYLIELVATDPLAGPGESPMRMAWRTTVTQPERMIVTKRFDR